MCVCVCVLGRGTLRTQLNTSIYRPPDCLPRQSVADLAGRMENGARLRTVVVLSAPNREPSGVEARRKAGELTMSKQISGCCFWTPPPLNDPPPSPRFWVTAHNNIVFMSCHAADVTVRPKGPILTTWQRRSVGESHKADPEALCPSGWG